MQISRRNALVSAGAAVITGAATVPLAIKAVATKAALASDPVCQSALNFDPLSASNIDPSCGREEVVQVVHRGDPRGFV